MKVQNGRNLAALAKESVDKIGLFLVPTTSFSLVPILVIYLQPSPAESCGKRLV
jgi:hypothetical protein